MVRLQEYDKRLDGEHMLKNLRVFKQTKNQRFFLC
jgi:hypothetical protein